MLIEHKMIILAVESWLRNPSCGVHVAESWLANPGCGILAVKSWLRNPSYGILSVKSIWASSAIFRIATLDL